MIKQDNRRTKVVKSFEGKALTAVEAEQVCRQDVDVLRLVYEPKAVPAIREFIKVVESNRGKAHRPPVMLDIASWTQAIVAGLAQPREVSFGDRLIVSTTNIPGGLTIKAANWERLFVADAKVFIGAGNVALRTLSVSSDRAELEVTQGGTIYPEMNVMVPETYRFQERLKVTHEELKPLIADGIDYIIVPGHWTQDTLKEFGERLRADHGDHAPWLILKVDSGDVYEVLESLLHHVDGVLISRRELALTVSPVNVPMMTKEIIQLCNDRAKVVLTASEMLASMRRNVTPTRAEVSDVANAVIDGTDAVMLSEEVANGRYGDKAVEVMSRIIVDIEARATNVQLNWVKRAPKVTNEMDAIAYHALRTAERIKAKAIVTITKAGNTARKLASFRAPVPIIAVTFSPAVMQRLSLVRGLECMLLDVAPNLDEVLPVVNDQLVRESWLKAGDQVIFVAISLSPVGREASNLFTVQTLS